jgi:DNA ligase (NAD+)|nr:MAG TPA: DNA ligase [Caudoviricetes sp.]
MKKIETFEDYRACVDEVKVHDFRYFSLNLPIISDEEYDTMYFALQEYEDAHPDEVLKDSPTQQCYSENGNGKRTVARRAACLSMKKVHDAKSVVKYLRAQQRAANISSKGAKVSVEWKFDGETVSLVYRRGMLSEATYGHGKELYGIDCLEHIKHVQGVPCQLAAWNEYDRVEVRGEVIISLEEFVRYSKAGKSPRSTSNGIMAKKVAISSECKRLEFHPFRLIMDGVVRHAAAMEALERNGFKTSGFVADFDLGKMDEELEQDIESIVCAAELDRENLPYPTDGLVFKFDNYDYYDRIGQTDHDAKYNCAFKFRPVFTAVTTYRGHHTTIGEKTGKVTYVADFDEVEMNGHRFVHANCGSARTFLQKNLTPGCQIEVSLHGDVIVCVDGKIESPDASHIEVPSMEDAIIPDEIAPSIESEIIHSPETEAQHHYSQAGEQSLNVNDKDKTARTRKKSSHIAQKIIAYTLMTFFFAGAGFLLFSLFGAAFFILPLLCGAFSK